MRGPSRRHGAELTSRPAGHASRATFEGPGRRARRIGAPARRAAGGHHASRWVRLRTPTLGDAPTKRHARISKGFDALLATWESSRVSGGRDVLPWDLS